MPKFDQSNTGLTFRFYRMKNWVDNEYKNAFLDLIIYHLLLFLVLCCVIKTSFSNPGKLHKEYVHIYIFINIY
jgi:hypothetical protein